MYLSKSILDGLSILGFDRETIERVSRERGLEEIFLSTLFMNYLIVLMLYFIGLLAGGFTLQGREVNMPILFGILMIYPFIFNLWVYVLYGLFGLVAEMLDNRNHIRPLLSVGFHTAIVMAIVFYVVALLSTISIGYGFLMFSAFLLYFICIMFVAISTIYRFSAGSTMIVLFTPLLIIAGIGIVLSLIFPDLLARILAIIY